MTHPTWELAIDHDAALVLTPCPGTKGISLTASLEQLKEQGVQAVVTAINSAEMASKNVQTLGEETQALGMQWFHLPIEDDCAPDAEFAEKWQQVSPELHKIVQQGGKIALHCMGGSGRTGLLAANLLLEMHWNLPTIIAKVQALRPGAFTREVQIEYVEALAKN
jgi:protein-tyrosine phosphatase